jgi:DNA-binding GntR family transcriptional regulator
MARKNLIENIYQDLKAKILTDTIYPGQKISEIALAAEYECSRTPIRETLKRLEDDGLVVIKPKSGTYVKNETPQDFTELMQVRAALERLAFHLAIEKTADKDILRLEKKINELDSLIAEEPIDMMRFARIHYEFHYTLIELSGNELLLRHFERLNLRSSHMFYQMMDKTLATDTQQEHRKIISLVKNRDSSGSDYIENHLDRKINRYLGKN